jgi:hypothetical protein
MSFFDRFLGARRKAEDLDPDLRLQMLKAWGLEADSAPVEVAARPAEIPVPATDLTYDRNQWHRRLKTLIADPPDDEEEWDHLVAEAKAKAFDPIWVAQAMREEFTLLVRAALADRVFTERERLKLDRARFLIGLTDAEADAIFKTVTAEAEAFFGGSIERY